MFPTNTVTGGPDGSLCLLVNEGRTVVGAAWCVTVGCCGGLYVLIGGAGIGGIGGAANMCGGIGITAGINGGGPPIGM